MRIYVAKVYIISNYLSEPELSIKKRYIVQVDEWVFALKDSQLSVVFVFSQHITIIKEPDIWEAVH